ncbi:unnamed protein product [Blepharisma stoltei]|uniref:RING-type domain-containing protein n=1 Tax=Blepharisma stoltei TaxID=1481888 RepID=A0AAU9JWB7_9CILI|nr:unnamed protein product [Blepharisma stoltei]
MECEICLEEFNLQANLPMVITCGHTLCRLCLRLIFNTENIICPFCREDIEKPLYEIKPNYSLLSLIDKPNSNPSPKNKNIHIRLELPWKLFWTTRYIVCENNHELTWVRHPEPKSCDVCYRAIDYGSFYCDQCNFSICECCENKVLREHFKISCPGEHKLQSKFCYYEDPSYCDSCGITIGGICKGCDMCDFDLCFNCLNQLKNSIVKGVFMGYKKLKWTARPYNITWNGISQSFICNVCECEYWNIGSFHYRDNENNDDLDVCILCSNFC